MARLRLKLVELQSFREALSISSLNIGSLLSSTFTLSPAPNALAEQMREMGLTPPPHIIPCLSACLRGLSLCHKLDLPRPLPPSPPLTCSLSPILIPTTTSHPFENSGPIHFWQRSRSGFQTQKMVPRDMKQRERMRLITEYCRVARRIGQQAALDCFQAVWRTGVDEMFHDMMGCHDCVQNGEVVYCEKSKYNRINVCMVLALVAVHSLLLLYSS